MSMLVLNPLPEATEIELYIIAGQSNASGRGELNQLPDFPLANRVKLFSNAYEWVDGYEPTDDWVGQVDTVSIDTNVAKVSAGMSFGDRLSRLRAGKIIGLVPCAKGGTGLWQWQRDLSRTTLYGSMLSRAKTAQAYGTLKGIIWYQGEHETAVGKQALAESYAADFLQFAADFCSDIGIPDLKFIVTELGPNPNPSVHPYWATVQAQQVSLDGERDGDIACVTAADLTGKVGDEVHLDTASQVILGSRYAETMAQLLS